MPPVLEDRLYILIVLDPNKGQFTGINAIMYYVRYTYPEAVLDILQSY